MSTIKVSNVQHGSAAAAAITLDANGQATLNGLAYPTSGSLSGRNRIINGDMRIDQRNAGASVSSGGFVFGVDRWNTYEASSGQFSFQKSTVAPAGFTNSLLFTVTTAHSSLAASDQYIFWQVIEGFNVADLGFGASGASPITISFWVRSSVAGTYPVSVINGSSNRSYVSTFNISAANTFEYKTITIPGDVTGTWATDNSQGLILRFTLGAGSDFNATANTWTAGYRLNTSGSTNFMATNGATFYITGVQLEAGSVATPFERRSYGQELALCQRYAYFIRQASTPGSVVGHGTATGASDAMINTKFPVTMRVAPTVTYSGMTITDSINYNLNTTSFGNLYMNTDYGRYFVNHSTGATQYRPSTFCTNGATDYVGFLAEL